MEGAVTHVELAMLILHHLQSHGFERTARVYKREAKERLQVPFRAMPPNLKSLDDILTDYLSLTSRETARRRAAASNSLAAGVLAALDAYAGVDGAPAPSRDLAGSFSGTGALAGPVSGTAGLVAGLSSAAAMSRPSPSLHLAALSFAGFAPAAPDPHPGGFAFPWAVPVGPDPAGLADPAEAALSSPTLVPPRHAPRKGSAPQRRKRARAPAAGPEGGGGLWAPAGDGGDSLFSPGLEHWSLEDQLLAPLQEEGLASLLQDGPLQARFGSTVAAYINQAQTAGEGGDGAQAAGEAAGASPASAARASPASAARASPAKASAPVSERPVSRASPVPPDLLDHEAAPLTYVGPLQDSLWGGNLTLLLDNLNAADPKLAEILGNGGASQLLPLAESGDVEAAVAAPLSAPPPALPRRSQRSRSQQSRLAPEKPLPERPLGSTTHSNLPGARDEGSRSRGAASRRATDAPLLPPQAGTSLLGELRKAMAGDDCAAPRGLPSAWAEPPSGTSLAESAPDSGVEPAAGASRPYCAEPGDCVSTGAGVGPRPAGPASGDAEARQARDPLASLLADALAPPLGLLPDALDQPGPMDALDAAVSRGSGTGAGSLVGRGAARRGGRPRGGEKPQGEAATGARDLGQPAPSADRAASLGVDFSLELAAAGLGTGLPSDLAAVVEDCIGY